jgi:hypothetical protein
MSPRKEEINLQQKQRGQAMGGGGEEADEEEAEENASRRVPETGGAERGGVWAARLRGFGLGERVLVSWAFRPKCSPSGSLFFLEKKIIEILYQSSSTKKRKKKERVCVNITYLRFQQRYDMLWGCICMEVNQILFFIFCYM